MTKIKMDKYDFVSEIIRVTKSIRHIYQELYKLDLNGNRDSSEYQKYLEYLRISREAEKDLYNECPDVPECSRLLDVYLETKSDDSSSDRMEIFTSDENALIKRRIQAFLFSMTDTTQDLKKMLTDLSSLTGFSLPVDTITEKISKSINVQESMLLDFKNTFLYFVREELKDNLMRKDESLRLAYDLIFSDICLEGRTLSNDFRLPEHIILSVDFIMESLGMNDEEFSDLKDKNISTIVLNGISNLVSIKDEDYGNESLLTRALLLVCVIRAGLMFLSEDMINCITEGFEEYKRTHFYHSVYPTYRTSESLIDNAIELHKKEQKEHLKIRRGNE